MRKYTYNYIALLGLLLASTSCEPEFDNPLEDSPITEESGNADFSNYVAVGASITAGFGDGALYIDGQDVAFSKLLATQMEAAGGGEFTTPYMADNIGGFAGVFETDEEDNLTTEPTFATRLIIDAVTELPVRANENMPANDPTASIAGLYNNMGVPGAKSFHAVFEGYGQLNPYFGRMASSTGTTMIADAVAQDPTFFSLWLGGNDVLSYATSGGTGVDQLSAQNNDPTTYGNSDITSANVFAGTVSSSVEALTSNGAGGVLFNVPSVTDLPFFTTVPYNPVPLTAEQVTALNSLEGFGAYNAGLLLAQQALAGTPFALSDEEIQKRTINFNEGEGNAVLIYDESLTDLEAIDPQFTGLAKLRQATAEDLLVLTSSSLIGEPVDPTDPETTVYGISEPLADQWVLTPEEQVLIATATATYNQTLEAIAGSYDNVMVFDANSLLSELKTTGLSFDGGTIYSVLGSAFSLDGIHLSPRGNAVFANEVIDEINDFYGATLEHTIPLNYKTITLKEFGL